MDEGAHKRLMELEKQWSQWTGLVFPTDLGDLEKQELIHLMDPNVMLVTFARRIVEYKRLLF